MQKITIIITAVGLSIRYNILYDPVQGVMKQEIKTGLKLKYLVYYMRLDNKQLTEFSGINVNLLV